MNIILLGPQHANNILDALPADAKRGDVYLLVGDKAVPGLGHCALVVIDGAQQQHPAGYVLVGTRRHAIKVDQVVDLLGFAIRELCLRTVPIEQAVKAMREARAAYDATAAEGHTREALDALDSARIELCDAADMLVPRSVAACLATVQS